MICPKWLVQSSTLGLMGATLVVAPMWLGSLERDAGTGTPDRIVEETDGTDVAAGYRARPSWHLESNDETGETDLRVRRVRHGLVEDAAGPQCLLEPHRESGEAVDRARSIVEESSDRAGDAASGTADERPVFDDALVR